MVLDIEYAIKLQELDNLILKLERKIEALPKHIAEIEEALLSKQRRLESDQLALSANQKDRRKLEAAIQTFEEKISKLKNQMLEAKTNEQYRAFQHEISYGETEIRNSEDKILDLMAESESIEANVSKARLALDEEKVQVEREKQAAREQHAVNEKQLNGLLADRERAVAAMTPKVYTSYERARKKYHGAALAQGINGRCSVCNIAMRPQYFQDLKKGERLLKCESCGRLLYYKPPVNPED